MKKRILGITLAAAMTVSLVNLPATQAASLLPAFPGAEGAGMYATGGRGGNVFHVTNLNDSGTGSFRDAVSGSNRIVVFDVGGTINLKSDVVVKGNVTILGQTAPGGAGITLRNGKIGMGGDNIIVRFISSRPGEKGASYTDGYDAWGGSAGSNSIIDHCSIGWATDEQFGLYSKNMNQTVQYSIIGPSNCISYHSKGAHGFGVMFGKGQNTWHHNMLAHSLSRNFRGKVEKTNSMDFVNNVIYDWGYQTAYGTLGHLNYMNNYLKAGPSTKGGYNFINISSGTAPENYRFYLTGNKMVDQNDTDTTNEKMAKLNANNWDGGVSYGSAGLTETDYRVDAPFKVSDVNGNDASYASKAESADEAYEHVLDYAGAGISADKRPAIDKQVMKEARTGTGNLTGTRVDATNNSTLLAEIEKYSIKQVDYDSYYPAGITQKEITDSDGDGMPDDWEVARGLNPNNASDAKGDYLGQGYMNIEYYANDLTVYAFPEGIVEVSPTTVDLGPEYTFLKEELEALTLSPTSIKFQTDLTLPQKGSVHNLDIVWTSSAPAIKISNNQISQVSRTSTDQTVILTANISNGGYEMRKSFSITVISNSSFWKASSANNGKPAGTELFDGLTALFDMTYGASDVTINDENFAGYVSHPSNSGKLENGAASGTAFRYEASENGYLTAYVVNLGQADNPKTLYIAEEGTQSYDDCLASVSGNNISTMLTSRVEAGKTYYVFVAGSKGRFVGIEFSPYAKTAWWKASKNVTKDEELMKNLTPMEDMTYTAANNREVAGETFTGGVSGTTNPNQSVYGAKGASLKFTPDADGTVVMYCKVNDTKTAKINDAEGNVVAEYLNDTGTNEYTSLSAELKKGVTYYLYVAGSKADFCGVSFTETAVFDEQPTPTSPAQPTGTPDVTSTDTPAQPTGTPDVTATDTPAQPTGTPDVTASTPPVEQKDRVEFEQDGNIVSAKLVFEKTTPPAQENIWFLVAYTENGRLKGVEISEITDMTATFEIPDGLEDCDITVYVWDKDMKPLMGKQKLD